METYDVATFLIDVLWLKDKDDLFWLTAYIWSGQCKRDNSYISWTVKEFSVDVADSNSTFSKVNHPENLNAQRHETLNFGSLA